MKNFIKIFSVVVLNDKLKKLIDSSLYRTDYRT